MTTRFFLLVLLLGIGSACASPKPKQQTRKLIQATIVERSAIPPFSGYLRTYVGFKVKADSSELDFFYPYFEEGKRLPEVGDVCDLAYHTESVDGHVGNIAINAKGSKVVDSFECESKGTEMVDFHP